MELEVKKEEPIEGVLECEMCDDGAKVVLTIGPVSMYGGIPHDLCGKSRCEDKIFEELYERQL